MCDLGYSYPQPSGVTEADCLAAKQLIAGTKAGIGKYSDYDRAIADGFRSIGDNRFGPWEHVIHWERLEDSHVMDPAYVESLVYFTLPDGSKELRSGMYILTAGSGFDSNPAEYASDLTPWHLHTNVCWTYGPEGTPIVTSYTPCAADHFVYPLAPMLHVWIVPTPCGPFAEVEGTEGDCSHRSH